MASFLDKLLNRTRSTGSAPRQFDAVYAQALTAAGSREFERAIPLYDQAIALDPTHAEAYYKRGNALKDIGQLDAAVASYENAIERQPDYAYAFCNRGVVQQALGLTAEALSSYDRAIAIDPTDSMTHYNRGLLLQELSRFDEALQCYNLAVELDPQFAAAQFNRSLALLLSGDFERGWPGFEWRWKSAQRLGIGALRNFSQPLWLGHEPIDGKRLLLHAEGGLGDTVQFCRYASLAAARGAIVYLEVQRPLLRLLAGLEGISRLIEMGSGLPEFDFHCPLMSLPLAFQTHLRSVPPPAKFPSVDEATIGYWRSRLPSQGRARVGLAWSGNPDNPVDSRRSIRLADWVGHLPTEFDCFCLQKDVRTEDQAVIDAHPRIRAIDFSALDFVDTAAICQCMDVVICVDTSVAHLSASLGRPTWLLLPALPDFRWLRDRHESPWYPSARLYRQPVAGDWRSVLMRVAEDLRREFPLV